MTATQETRVIAADGSSRVFVQPINDQGVPSGPGWFADTRTDAPPRGFFSRLAWWRS